MATKKASRRKTFRDAFSISDPVPAGSRRPLQEQRQAARFYYTILGCTLTALQPLSCPLFSAKKFHSATLTNKV